MKSYNDFARYLSSKKSVDDRALNQHVWQSLREALHDDELPTSPTWNILEIGGGIGTMVERLLIHDLLPNAVYTLMDESVANIQVAGQRLPAWAQQHGFGVQPLENPPLPSFRLYQPAKDKALTLHLLGRDLYSLATEQSYHTQYNLLIAHAFLDLLDIPTALHAIRQLLQPDALLYLTINFDGATLLQPEIDPPFDAHIERLYHRTMDERLVNGRPSGDSQSGRHLFGHLCDAGIEVLDAGSSDWVVFAKGGVYPADEAYFLHFIVETMRGALAHHPELDQHKFADWIEQRHAQIEAGELVYIAHQLDFLART